MSDETERETFVVLVTEEGKCGCCLGIGDHHCGHECDSCDGSGRDPDAPVCEPPHGADCDCPRIETSG